MLLTLRDIVLDPVDSAAAASLPSPAPAGRASVNARAAAQNDGAHHRVHAADDLGIEHARRLIGRTYVEFLAGRVGDSRDDVRIDAEAAIAVGAEGRNHVPQVRFDRAQCDRGRHEGVALGHIVHAEATRNVSDPRLADLVGDLGGDGVRPPAVGVGIGARRGGAEQYRDGPGHRDDGRDAVYVVRRAGVLFVDRDATSAGGGA